MPHPDRPSRPRADPRDDRSSRGPQRPRDASPNDAAPPRDASRSPDPRADRRGPPRDTRPGPPRDAPRDDRRDAPRNASRESGTPRSDAPRNFAGAPRSDAPRNFSGAPRSDAPRDTRGDGPRNFSRDTRGDAPRNFSRDAPRNTRGDGPGNSSREAPRDARRDASREAPRDEPRPEIKICGVNACHAVADRRPDDVRRVYLRESLLPAFGAFLKRCAAAKIAYHVVEDAELEKITHSTHHEGVCFIVRERAPVSLRQLLAVPGPRCLVYLDGVQNPHNLGAIVRVCAHFGAAAVLAAGADDVVSTSMLRTAEGGGEFVDVVSIPTGTEPLLAARAAGYRLIATAARATHDLHSLRLPARAIIMLGSETHGLSPALAKLADDSVRIPGTGRLDSLNVACAASVLLSEYWRSHAATAGGPAA